MPTVAAAALAVLLAAEPRDKVRAARAAARAWRRGALEHAFDVAMPDSPARPGRPPLLPPSQMPKRGRGGSERGRIAMLHALAHIEYSAIDLAFDLAGRFGGQFPRNFVDDWFAVGADEAMHFALLDRRLKTLGSAYGDLPAHDGLWEAAAATAGDPLARLAVVPRCLKRAASTSLRRRWPGSRRPATPVRRRSSAGSTVTRYGTSQPVRNGSTTGVNREESTRFRPGSGSSARIFEALLSLHSTIQRATKPVCPAITIWRLPWQEMFNSLGSHVAEGAFPDVIEGAETP
jgi:hypothetical protein